MKKALFIILAVICFAIPFPSWIHSIVRRVQFDGNCGGYLKMSADANSIEIAEKHLTTAIDYLENNNLTTGNTSIIIYRPTNDIGMWYENLKSAQNQLQDMINEGTSSELEKSNMLMKLRETLLDDGESLTTPARIAIADNFRITFWLNVTLWVFWVGTAIFAYLACEEY